MTILLILRTHTRAAQTATIDSVIDLLILFFIPLSAGCGTGDAGGDGSGAGGLEKGCW